MGLEAVADVQITGTMEPGFEEILTPEAVTFLARLHRNFDARRRALLDLRDERQRDFDSGMLPGFLPETAPVRDAQWTVAPVPGPLQDRRVEITGPVERKMVINALNSGARAFMADFEDSNAPTWSNNVQGQRNLRDAIDRTITFTGKDGREYRLAEETAVLLVRPRGWHLLERHMLVDGEPMSGSLFDFGLYLFHNHTRLADRGWGPWFYLPKLESHLEARLWNDVFVHAQDSLGIPQGTIKATVLIETVLGALEMDEILYELREHSAGLNAGRWDYIFSFIKKFRSRSDMVMPDRLDVTMTVPFLASYCELLVKTCHHRGAFAMGGMAAVIPNRRDEAANEIALGKVRADKQREASLGFDGTWVAHPDLVPVAMAEFDAVLGDRPNQLDRQRDDISVGAAQLLDVAATPGAVTEAGLRNNVSVGIQYLSSWLRGNGAVAIYNLMEDAATAEIARSQVWQWIHTGTVLSDGRPVTAELVRTIAAEELAALRAQVGEADWAATRGDEAAQQFERVAISDEFVDFLTLPAYDLID